MKKITTLIPAYKTEYFGELLIALNNQTYKNFSVIISDDSPNGKITELLQSANFRPLVTGLQIEVIQGPRQGAMHNTLQLLTIATEKSELLHLLFDDDFIYPRFYEYHLGFHETPDVLCSVSRRWTSAATGMPIGILQAPPDVEQAMARALVLDSDRLFKTVVPTCDNWLGEFSNCLFKRESIPLLLEPQMGGISCKGLWDIVYFLKASMIGKVAFLQDHLGFFRQSPGQNTAQMDSPIRKASFLGWCAVAIASVNLGKLPRHEAYMTFRKVAGMIAVNYPRDAGMQKFSVLLSAHTELTDDLIRDFTQLWDDFLDTCNFVF